MKASTLGQLISPCSEAARGCSLGLRRRDFLAQAVMALGGCVVGLNGGWLVAGAPASSGRALVSPGCRRSKVKVAKIYLGRPGAHWPTPKLDLEAERQRYEAEFVRSAKEFADIEFVSNALVTQKEELQELKEKLGEVDGVLAIHLSMGVLEMVEALLASQRPMVLFAAPYSGHEWTQFGALRRKEGGQRLECLLTADLGQLGVAVRPFRASHHLREAKILNLTTRPPGAERLELVRGKLGTEIKTVPLPRMLELYERVEAELAEAETERWVRQAERVVEPPREEIYNSCKLALAFERLLAEEEATVLTVDCYGSMYRQLPAFPCLGFVRLNNLGLGGICESDLSSALTYVLFQGLVGRPGFISDPTVDEAVNGIILAHCLGTMKMDGPAGESAPYRLRTIMERQEGVVPQVRMRTGQKVTQAILVGTDQIRFFTGKIIEVPETEKGCRTKITVEPDGDLTYLWQNWSHGLHRVTCYGDLRPDLQRFCRFQGIRLIDEARDVDRDVAS